MSLFQNGLTASDWQVIVASKGTKTLIGTVGLLRLQHGAAGEIAFAFQMDAEPKTRFDGCVIGGDIGAPVEIAFFQTQRFNGAVADIADAVRLPGLPQEVIDVASEFGGDVQLPAQLSDVSDAHGQGVGGADDDVLGGAKREDRV